MSVEVEFSNYQEVNGVQIPFKVQRLLNGNMLLQVTISRATINTGLQESLFTLQ
jgi:hypothetical protein